MQLTTYERDRLRQIERALNDEEPVLARALTDMTTPETVSSTIGSTRGPWPQIAALTIAPVAATLVIIIEDHPGYLATLIAVAALAITLGVAWLLRRDGTKRFRAADGFQPGQGFLPPGWWPR